MAANKKMIYRHFGGLVVDDDSAIFSKNSGENRSFDLVFQSFDINIEKFRLVEPNL